MRLPHLASRCLGALAAVSSLVLLLPAHVLAHASVDEARRLYEEAEFVAALDLLGRATAGDELTLADLEEVYELRALVHVALGDAAAMQDDLNTLAAIAPDHELDRGMPPDVQRAWAETRARAPGAIRVVAETETGASGVTVSVEVSGDALHLVRRVRIRGRAGEGAVAEAIDAPLFVGTPTGEEVTYWAEAIGPGGAVLASSGSEASPLRASGAAVGSGDEGGGLEAWPFLVAGGGVLVVGAVIVIAVVATQGGTPNTTVEPFVVHF